MYENLTVGVSSLAVCQVCKPGTNTVSTPNETHIHGASGASGNTVLANSAVTCVLSGTLDHGDTVLTEYSKIGSGLGESGDRVRPKLNRNGDAMRFGRGMYSMTYYCGRLNKDMEGGKYCGGGKDRFDGGEQCKACMYFTGH